jgi:hypothetical protein
MSAVIRALVCSFLEKEQVARIAAHPDVEVVYRPDLLPQPRYPCDHHGPAPALTAAERAEWAALLRQADICFDFDWEEPAAMPTRAPGVRWVQAGSSGIGQFMGRAGLAGWTAVVTTAAGIHAQPIGATAQAPPSGRGHDCAADGSSARLTGRGRTRTRAPAGAV